MAAKSAVMDLQGFMTVPALLMVLAATLPGARGESPFASLDALDLNDYALGVATSVNGQPYRGVSPTYIFYPYLTSVEDSTLTDSALIARNGTYGLRTVRDSGLEIGILGRIETLGFGADPDPPTNEFEAPEWTLEVGPSIGWRRGLLQPDLALRKGLSGGHGGWVGEATLSMPIEGARGYLVPWIGIAYRGEDYLRHYFEPRPRDASVPAPHYEVPDSAFGYRLGVRAGYRLSDLWVVTGSLTWDRLAPEVSDSPLVDTRQVFGVNLGLAYNRSVFVSNNDDWRGDLTRPRLTLSAMSVAGSVRGELSLQDLGTGAGDEPAQLPFNLDERPRYGRFDAILRLPERHRVEASYTRIRRRAVIEAGGSGLPADFDDGGIFEQESRFARLAYGYSLLLSPQKEAGVLLGLQWPRHEARWRNEFGSTVREADVSSPFFSLGVFGQAALRHKFSARARVELGGLTIGRYDGTLLDARFSLAWNPTGQIALVAGYSWQIAHIEGYGDRFQGRFEQRTRGPMLGLELTL